MNEANLQTAIVMQIDNLQRRAGRLYHEANELRLLMEKAPMGFHPVALAGYVDTLKKIEGLVD